MVASDFINKFVVGQELKYKRKLGYPFSPRDWRWTFGTYVGPWSIDEIVLKVGKNPVILRWNEVFDVSA